MDGVVERNKARLASLLSEAGERRRSDMSSLPAQFYYGPVFNGEVKITTINIGQALAAGEGRRAMVQSILNLVNSNGLQDWLGDFLHSEFSASGLMDLTDPELQAAHAAVICKGAA